MNFFACKTGYIIYRWKANVILINICRRTIPRKPMVFELQPVNYYLITSSICGQIGQISDILETYWKHNLILINFYYGAMPFKLQIWELQTFKCDVLKSLFLFQIWVFCLPVSIEEHLREKYLHLKIRKRKTDNGETELVSQKIILFKTDDLIKSVHFFY